MFLGVCAQAKLRTYTAKLKGWQAHKLAAFGAEFTSRAEYEAGRAKYAATLAATVDKKLKVARAKLIANREYACGGGAAAAAGTGPKPGIPGLRSKLLHIDAAGECTECTVERHHAQHSPLGDSPHDKGSYDAWLAQGSGAAWSSLLHEEEC